MKLKRIIFSVLYTLIPSVSAVFLVGIYRLFWELYRADIIFLCVVLMYIFTIVIIVLFFKFKPCNILFLLSGFLLFSFWVFINDFITGGFLQYLSTFYVSVFYSAPFMLISLLIFTISFIIKREKTKNSIKDSFA
ncbi:MAG: hypothetical protein LBC82_09335 [Oscillospiraceae bacterium]|jgi:hypothetical protein|nr:hypothetical protein [Oscillospiraceae bacterium]